MFSPGLEGNTGQGKLKSSTIGITPSNAQLDDPISGPDDPRWGNYRHNISDYGADDWRNSELNCKDPMKMELIVQILLTHTSENASQ